MAAKNGVAGISGGVCGETVVTKNSVRVECESEKTFG